MLRAASLSLAFVVALLAVFPPDAPAQNAATPSAPAPTAQPEPYVRPPAPGQLVDIGGRRLHVLCKGDAAAPSVIFEAGLSQFTATGTYGRAQDLIAPFARVCVYDRAGLGWSDPDTEPRTHQRMVRDLHRLLDKADVPGPYILVGHSMGGLTARLYARTYPRQVAGVLLLDSSSEAINFTPQAATERAATEAQIDQGIAAGTPGQPIIQLPAGTPMDAVMAFTPEILRGVREEYAAVDRAAATPAMYGTLGHTPLIVMRRGREVLGPEIEGRWRASQEQLISLSSNSTLIVATNAGHVIPYDDPQVVADAVRRMLEAIRTRGQL